MCLSIPLSGPLEAALRKQAEEAGVSPEVLAARLVERSLRNTPGLTTISGDTHEAFTKSGMTEEELSDLLEQEKHAMRAEKRTKAL